MGPIGLAGVCCWRTLQCVLMSQPFTKPCFSQGFAISSVAWLALTGLLCTHADSLVLLYYLWEPECCPETKLLVTRKKCPAILGDLQGLLLLKSSPEFEFSSSRKAMARPRCHPGIRDFDTG